MKTLILTTILAQILLVIPFLVYATKRGYWGFLFPTFRQIFHIVLLGVLIAFADGLNPIILVVYLGVVLEELFRVKTFNAMYDRLFKGPQSPSDASIRPTVRFGVLEFIWGGIQIDFAILLVIIVNLIDIRRIFNPDHIDPVCRLEGEHMSLNQIIFDPSNSGHETLKVIVLGLMYIL